MINIRQQLSRISPLSVSVILLFAAAMTYLLFRVFAASGTATLYTSPGGTRAVTSGQSFTVNVRISTGSSVPVTGAAVYLSYPADKLRVLGQSYAGSSYSTQLAASNSGGVLRMDRAAFPAISGGDRLFAQVSFKAIATGSATIGFTGSSIVTSGEDDSNILTQKNGVTYNISAPATPSPTSTSGSGGSSTSGSSSSGTTSSGSTSSGSSKPSSTARGSHSSSTGADSSPENSSAGTPAGAADAGNDGLTASQVISTVNITILDSRNRPIEGAAVTINDQTAKTDKDGVVQFENVPAGNQKVVVKYNGQTTDKVVEVKGAHTTVAPEKFKLAVARNKFNPTVLILPVLVLLGAGIVLWRPWNRFVHTPAAGAASDAVISQEPSGPIDPIQTATPVSPAKDVPGAVIKPDQPAEPEAPVGRKTEKPGTVYGSDNNSNNDTSDKSPQV